MSDELTNYITSFFLDSHPWFIAVWWKLEN